MDEDFSQMTKVQEIENHEQVHFMYRQPGLSSHQNITDVLDEIILAVRELSERVIVLEEFCDDIAKLDLEDSNYGGTD